MRILLSSLFLLSTIYGGAELHFTVFFVEFDDDLGFNLFGLTGLDG